MTPINLPSCLRNSATESGVDFFGIADLDGFAADFKEIWPLPLNGLPCGISIGIALNRWVVDRISETRDVPAGKLYWQQCYTVVNERLDWIAVRLAAQLEKGGFRAVPVPATVKVDSEGLLGPMTHKAVARMAGLGWIGKSCLLVTPEVGPRVRWATVLTDAPLTPTASPMEDGCGTCTACVKACPAQAFTGRSFQQGEPVSSRYDVHKCKSYLASVPVCGLCLASCPHGQKAPSAEQDNGE